MSIREHEITIEAFLQQDQEKLIPSILTDLSKMNGLLVEQVQLKSIDGGIVIELDCVSESAGKESRGTAGNDDELSKVLDRLFPEERLEIVPMKSSVAVRGSVSNVETSAMVISVVEQYYPTVLNFLSIGGSDAKSQPAMTSETSGSDEPIAELRAEIRSLHADVKTLMKLMEARPRRAGRY